MQGSAVIRDKNMQIQCFGAAGEVTGSCHLVQVGASRVLLDCGLIQGGPKDKIRNRKPFPFDPRSIDAVVLSHAHIDHSGRIPLLMKAGFRGPVYSQNACRDLCEIMLKDSGFLHEKESEWENRKRERKGLPPVEPLYTLQDAEAVMTCFKGLPYQRRLEILPGVELRLSDAGHILGSAIVELWLQEGQQRRKVVFSGDLGHPGAPILRDPAVVGEADLVLMESTYGDRMHRSREETRLEVQEIIAAARRAQGNILIPAFAIGRTQELLYLFGKYHQAWDLQHWRIFLDSPMAIEATEVYLRHSNLYDTEALELFRRNRRLPLLPNLTFSRSTDQSIGLNRIRSGAIIVAASGMCEGGRIKHHLKHNVWRKDCHVIIVGYQARGTLGRRLVDGARYIRLWGEAVQVKATVHTIGGFSAHADQAALVEWYRHFEKRPPLLLVHGEAGAAAVLAQRLRTELHAPVRPARPGESIDLGQPFHSSNISAHKGT
jgi:metallo-beta-lactamase family protein